jgi:hypothetical protein
MNDTSLTQLKVIVERAVRPVRASFARKQKMREELLAHVADVFTEEAARLGDEGALERTAQRFGDPAELTGQLQKSVPFSDALERFAEWLWFRPGESTLRRALRHGLLAVLGAGALLGPLAWVIWARLREWPPEAFVPLSASVVNVFFFVFTFTFLAEGMRRALFQPSGPAWLGAGLLGLASAVLFLPFVALAVLIQPGARLRPTDLLILLGATALASSILVAMARALATRMQMHREWADLSLG